MLPASTTRRTDVNSVNLIGNLSSDVELRELGDEKKVANFRIAVDRGGKDAGADFFRVAVWDRQAELCAQYLCKGKRVGIEGRLRSHSWEDAGQKRSLVEVVANRVQFLSPTQELAEVVPFEPAVAS
jgi:single-strand DNA-binding protein